MISLNSSVEDSLTLDSQNHPGKGEGYFRQEYQLIDLVVGEPVQISLASENFYSYIELRNLETKEVIFDRVYLDDSNITFTPQLGIDYFIRVGNKKQNEIGNYSLTVDKYDVDYEPDLLLESGLEPEASYTATKVLPGSYSWSPEQIESGERYLIINAGSSYLGEYEYDSYGDINIANNLSVIPITVLPAPDNLDLDLIPTAINAPETVTASEELNVSWTVNNQGADANVSSWQDKLYLSEDEQIDENDILLTDGYDYYYFDYWDEYYLPNLWTGSLPGEGSYTIDKSFDLDYVDGTKPGDYYLVLNVDVDNESLEKDRSNNTLAVPITITPPDIDLEITTYDIPAVGVIGETINLSWTVTNQGTDTQNHTWSDRIYISDDEYLDESDISIGEYYHPLRIETDYDSYFTPLVGGGRESANSSVTLASLDGKEITDGDHNLLIVLDSDDSTIEKDKTNNVLSVPITLIAPENRDVDLEVTNFTLAEPIEIDPDSDNEDLYDVNVSWTVSNLGTASTSTDWKDRIYLSQDRTLDDSDIVLDDAAGCGGYDCMYFYLYEGEKNIYHQSTSIAGQSSYTVNLGLNLINLPHLDSVDVGNAYFILVTDDDNELAESNDDNNTFLLPINIAKKNNTTPEVTKKIADLTITSETSLQFTLPQDAFNDLDAEDSLTYSATLVDNSELPDWLTFDADTQTFSGIPNHDDLAVLEIKVAATDLSGASVSDSFILTVESLTKDYKDSMIYRFYNPAAGVHFYTADEVEKNYVKDNLDYYSWEGESYYSVDEASGGKEVHRFYNSQTGVHLYTTDKVEKDFIIKNLDSFGYEGVQFYAYETQINDSIPVYRFYEPSIGVHFYTPNEAEKTFVEENLSNYKFEGIAYYAFSTPT